MPILDRFRGLKRPWRILLAILALGCAGLLVLAIVLWLGWRRHRAVPLERWVPDGATFAARVRDVPALLQAWDHSALRAAAESERAAIEEALSSAGVELPVFIGRGFRIDLARTIPDGAPSVLTPERVLAALERDVMIVGGVDSGRGTACAALRLPFTHYAAAAIGTCLGGFLGLESRSVEGVRVQSLAAGDHTLYLTLAGDVLVVGTSAREVARIVGRSSARSPGGLGEWIGELGTGTVGFALDAEAMRRGDPALWALFRDALATVPLQEALWTFDPDPVGRMGGEIVIGADGISIEGTGSLVPGSMPPRVRDAFHADPRVWAVTDLLPETTVFASLTRNGGQGTWDSLRALAAGADRGGISPAVREIAEVVYRELDGLLAVAEQRGIDREIVPSLGGEVAWAVFVEPGPSAGGGAPGFAVVLETEEGDALLRALDRWGAELGEGEDAVNVERRRIDGVDVRLITSRFNRWSEVLTPCFAWVQGKLVASTSLSYLRRVLRFATGGGGGGFVPWYTHAREAIAVRGNGAAVLDFGMLAVLAEESAAGLTALLSDRVDRVAIRERLRSRVARETGLSGSALEDRLDGAVAQEVERETAALEGRIRDAARALRKLVVLAGEWSAAGTELSFRAALLTPKVD